MANEKRLIELTGKRFGKLVVLEYARFDLKVFPCEDVVQIVKNGYTYWHICKFSKTDDESLMMAYRKMFEDTEAPKGE